MSHHSRFVSDGRRTATGPGLRDLLRSPSGLGGRPGGGHPASTREAMNDQ
jgi:hypothetical protein